MARPKKATAAAKAATPATQTAPEQEAAPKPKQVTVYFMNDAQDEDSGPKKPVKPDSVGGVILEIIQELDGATKSAILEGFRAHEKSSAIKANQWVAKPQEYVNGYVDWLKGNRSVISEKREVSA
jgi:hypothetical protein